MKAKIWNFSKRHNSLSLPPASAPWEPEVNLKASCSMESPVLLLGSPRGWDEISQYNYCKLGNGEYYYIDEWISVRGDLWEAHCERDMLATYRAEILETTAFVEYDTTPNTWIPDHRMSINANGTRSANSSALPFTPLVGGMYIVCVTGQRGSVDYFAIGGTYMQKLLDSVRDWSDIRVEEMQDPIRELILCFNTWATKALSTGSAPQNIRGCIWVPWAVDGSVSSIYLGTYDTGQNGRRITEPVKNGGAILAIPWQASDWRQCSLCHTIELYLPYCGVVGIDAGLCAGESELVVDWSVDWRTADIVYNVNVGDANGLCVGSYSGNAGVNIPLGLTSYNPVGIAGSIMSGIGAAFSGNVGGAVGSLAQTAQNILVPNVTAVGTQTSGAASLLPQNSRITVTTLFHNTNVSPSSLSTVMGTPAMAVKRLGDLSGFVKTRGASVKANSGASELRTINALLDGGIYIE